MHVRRWWYSGALVLAVSLVGSVQGQTATPAASAPAAPVAPAAAPLPAPTVAPPDWTADDKTIRAFLKDEASRLQAAGTAADAKSVRDYVLQVLESKRVGTTVAEPSPEFRRTFARVSSQEFKALTLNTKPDVSFNAVVILVQQRNFETDGALDAALGNASNPAVRYWAARGLSAIVDKLHDIPTAIPNAVNALTAAIKVEKAPPVEAEILRALQAASDPTGDSKLAPAVASTVTDALARKAAALATGPVKPGDVDAIVAGVNCLISTYPNASMTPAQETAALQAAVDAVGHAADRMLGQVLASPPIAPPAEQVLALYDAANATQELANKIANMRGKKPIELKGFRPTFNTTTTPPDIIAAATKVISEYIKPLVGGEVDGPQAIQKAFPGVKVPSKVK